MRKVLELSEQTYQLLGELAQQQHRTPEDMLGVCLATYEATRYERVHRQMVAEGLLRALPTRPLAPDVEDFEPEEIPGPPLSETMREEPPSPGRPPLHEEAWRKVTVVLLNRHMVFLDRLATDIRERTGTAMTRAEIIRALIDVLAESDLDLTSATSAAELKALLAARPRP